MCHKRKKAFECNRGVRAHTIYVLFAFVVPNNIISGQFELSEMTTKGIPAMNIPIQYMSALILVGGGNLSEV